jgi:DNA-binding NarL/FixJ family response regulator
MTGGTRVVIGHDDGLVREMLGLACLRKEVEVVGMAVTYADLLAHCLQLAPDVAVTGDCLDGTRVEDVLDSVLATDVRIIVLSADPSPERLGHLLARDVSGFLSHDAGPDEVVSGIVAVARGEMALNSAMLTTILHQWRRLRSQPATIGVMRRATLTPREQEIMAAMTDGLAAKAIAARLGMATKTVENHKIRIFEKLGVRSHAHAVTVSMAYGLTGAAAEASGQGRGDPDFDDDDA